MVCTQGKVSTIAGGFVFVPVASLLNTWRACRSKPLGIGDFRTWLACREMNARRCLAEPARAPAYGATELAKLTGVSLKRATASINRLVAARLLEWSDAAIGFPEPPQQDLELEDSITDSIGGGRGSVAIPRRILRLLAAGARPALIATVLGILLRCLSRRRGGFHGRGRVKASWIARVFAVDLSRVKLARNELVAIGWIEPEESEQWSLNRWGKPYRIRLDWDRIEGPRTPPPRPVEGTRSLPPSLDQEPFQEEGIQHQEPASGGPAGVELEGSGEGSKALPAPNLDDIRSEDLRDVGRTLRLFDQAVARKLVGASEADRLKFVAVAEHARVVGTVNPGGLLARLVGRGWWHFATQEDEDAAAKRLRGHLHGGGPAVERPAGRSSSFVADGVVAGPASLGSVLVRLMNGGGLVRPVG